MQGRAARGVEVGNPSSLKRKSSIENFETSSSGSESSGSGESGGGLRKRMGDRAPRRSGGG